MSWTEGRKRAFITAVLRGGMRRFPPKYETLNKAYVGTKVNEKTKRLAKHYECNMCKQHFTAKDVEVDHVNPVVDPDVGFVSWDLFIERLYCKMENLQLLCKECHKVKTKEERTARKDAKRIPTESVSLRTTDSAEAGVPDTGTSGRGRGSGKRVRKSGAKGYTNRPPSTTRRAR
jgi:5-methylcytosine-specific restriction endonuclease McrA